MKKILFVLGMFAIVFAIGDVSKPNTFTPNTLIQSSKINANFDSSFRSINHLKDTVEQKFIRFKDLTDHDSTLSYVQIDSIMSSPFIDTITSKKITSADSVKAATFKATANILADSMSLAKGVSATIGNFSGKVSGDSLVSAKGARITNTIVADSIVLTKGINCTQINTGNGNTEIPVYTTSTFACSLKDGGTYRASGTAQYTKIGKIVHVKFPQLNGTVSSVMGLFGFPAAICPDIGTNVPIIIRDGGTYKCGLIYFETVIVSEGGAYVKSVAGVDITAGANSGIPKTEIVYEVE